MLFDLTVDIYTGASLAALRPVVKYEVFNGRYVFRALAGVNYSFRVASGNERRYYGLASITPRADTVFDYLAIEDLRFEDVGGAWRSYTNDGIPNYIKQFFGFDLLLPMGHPSQAAARARMPRQVISPGRLEFRCIAADPASLPAGGPGDILRGGYVSDDLRIWSYQEPVVLPGGEFSVGIPTTGPRIFLRWDPLEILTD